MAAPTLPPAFLVFPTRTSVYTWKIVGRESNHTVSRHRELHLALARAEALNLRAAQAANLFPDCTHIDEGDYECGDPAIVHVLPNGDEALCAKHLRRRRIQQALAEVQ